jgi:putative nucleotidyltransferase with HDIG domain
MITTFNPIHAIILRRLAVAWILLSLLFGGIAYFLELEKIDDFVVALATSESSRFTELGISLEAPKNEAASTAMQEKAREFAGQNFVIIEIYDRQHNKLIEAVSPRYAALEHKLSKRSHAFPIDGRPHYERLTLMTTSLVQILVPLRDPQENITGYFEGVFVIDPATVARLRADLLRNLTITLFAVLLTTVALYPVILSLNRKVLEFSREVVKGNLEMASVLGAAIAKRDSDTNTHNYRVTLYAIALGEAVGIDTTAMRALILGALLHDVGKIGISDNILLKPGKLTADEFAIMRTHVDLGFDILREAAWLQAALDVVCNHHEKFDGNGYPQGRAGADIPLNARIFAIVDVFDALAATRPYKESMSCAAALEIIQQGAGTHFDPVLVPTFIALAPELHRRYASAEDADLNPILRERGMHYFFAAAQLKSV